MSNPFKIKQLDEFTIEDCKSYLNQYPYGEHYIAVQKRYNDLRRGKIKIPIERTDNEEVINHQKQKAQQARPTINREGLPEHDDKDRQRGDNTEISLQSRNLGDKILSWIGLFVVILIIGTIIIFVLDAILPDEAIEFIGKNKYLIYPICLAIGKWVEEKL